MKKVQFSTLSTLAQHLEQELISQYAITLISRRQVTHNSHIRTETVDTKNAINTQLLFSQVRKTEIIS